MAKKLKWGSIENLNNIIDNYFIERSVPGGVPTIPGLRLALGIGESCWKYYVNELWRTHRRSDEEIEAANKAKEDNDIDEIMEEWEEIPSYTYLIEEFSQGSKEDNDVLKTHVSTAFKKGRDKIEDWVTSQMFTSKNPAGPIFYSKAALGYRENDPISNNNDNGPTFNVVIQLAAPVQKPVIEIQKVVDIKQIPDA